MALDNQINTQRAILTDNSRVNIGLQNTVLGITEIMKYDPERL